MRQDVDRAAGPRHAGRRARCASFRVSPENFAYVTGFLSPTQPLMRWRHAMALVTADARASRSSSSTWRRARSAPNRRRAPRLRSGREFEFDAMDVLADLLRNATALAESRIGIEMDYLPAGDFAALRERLPAGPFCAGAGHARAPARDQDAGGDRYSAQAVAHRRPGDHRSLSRGARAARARWTWPPRSRAASTSKARNISS